MDGYILVIDNGGTNIKAVLFDFKGKQLAAAGQPTPRIDLQGEKREVDMHKIWDAVVYTVNAVIREAGISAEQIRGIDTVGHGKGLYLLDKEKQIFRNGILSADNRAQELLGELTDVQAAIEQISLQPILASQSPALLRWLKKYEPADYARIGHVFSAKDYIRFRLTDEIYGEYTDTSGNNLINLTSGQYDDELLRLFGIEEMKNALPQLKRSFDACGTTTDKLKQQTNIPVGTPVFAGMFDIDACSIATAVVNEEYISMVAGTWSINTYVSAIPAPLKTGIMNSRFVDNQNYLVESSSPTSAGNLDIMIKLLLKEEIAKAKESGQSIYDKCEAYLKETNATSTDIIYLPFLYGSNVNPNAKGTFIGLSSDTSAFELLRSVYEGIIFSHKYHLEQLLAVKEAPTKAIRLSGGAVNSLSWVQLFADILEYPIEVVEAKELGALGGAIGVAIGLGTYPDVERAIENMTRVKSTFQPNTKESQYYQSKYKKYKEIIEALDHIW